MERRYQCHTLQKRDNEDAARNPDGLPQEIIDGTKKLSEGHSIYDFWLRDYAGVDPQGRRAIPD
jgi:hypothetical protein